MADEPTTTGQPETTDATAAGDGQPGQAAPVTFTQEQLDTILKERLARAMAGTKTDLLTELGAEDLETVKKTLADAAKAREAQMSELEKAHAQTAEAQAQAAQVTAEAEAIKAQAAEALLKAAVVSQASDFHNPMQAWLLIDRSKIEIQDDGTYKGVDEAIKTLAETDPHLVKAEDGSSGPGTPARAKQKSIVEKLFEDKKKTEAGEKRPSTVRM